jgi:hypothetical protein
LNKHHQDIKTLSLIHFWWQSVELWINNEKMQLVLKSNTNIKMQVWTEIELLCWLMDVEQNIYFVFHLFLHFVFAFYFVCLLLPFFTFEFLLISNLICKANRKLNSIACVWIHLFCYATSVNQSWLGCYAVEPFAASCTCEAWNEDVKEQLN